MAAAFWGLVVLAAYPYLVYPVLLVGYSYLRRRPVRRGPVLPSVAVVITAYNEEKHLAAKLDNVLALDYPRERREVVVVSDGATDGTEAVAAGYAGRGVKLVVLPRSGKTAAQQAGVEASKGEVLLFTDVTAHCRPEAARLLVENLADESVGAVSVRVDFGEGGGSQTERGLGLRQRYDNYLRGRMSALYTMFGASGAMYALRRSAYRPPPPEATSDFVSSLWALEQGQRTVLDERVVVRMVRGGPSLEAEYARRVRIVQGGVEGLMLARGLLNPLRWGGLALSLVSSRLARYLVGVWMLALLPVSLALAAAQPAYWWAVGAQALCYLGALGGWLGERAGVRLAALHVPFYFCLVHLAALAGLGRALAGKQVATWETRR